MHDLVHVGMGVHRASGACSMAYEQRLAEECVMLDLSSPFGKACAVWHIALTCSCRLAVRHDTIFADHDQVLVSVESVRDSHTSACICFYGPVDAASRRIGQKVN